MASNTKFFRITPKSRSRTREGYRRQSSPVNSANESSGACPYQAQSQPQNHANQTQNENGQRPPAPTPTFNQHKCNCCLRKFSMLERFLTFGRKRCQRCRKVSCKHCVSNGSRCHLCAVRNRNNGALTPQYLLTLEDREMVDILSSLHYRDIDFVGWPKAHLVKQILTRLDIYHDWDPSTALSSKSERKTPGKSPKRRKRQPGHESKRSKTLDEEEAGDTRTTELIDVINKQMTITEKKVEPAEKVPAEPQQQPIQTLITVTQEHPAPRNKSSKRKLSIRLRKSVYGVTPTARVARRKHKNANLPIEDLCKICMDTVPNCVFLNCGHMVSCNKCAHLVQECPICRSPIVKIQKVYKS